MTATGTTPLFSVEQHKSAAFSRCGTYRYELTRTWDEELPTVTWIMLNPSTADAETDDPTIRRCIGFAKAWSRGGIIVRNLYALRATDPRDLLKHPDPIGPHNDEYLWGSLDEEMTVCAWGAHGRRGDEVLQALGDAGCLPHYLALTDAGEPRHPLYLPGRLKPQPFARFLQVEGL